MKDLLGGKGANLADMTLAGLPVPPGFTITTQTCYDYNAGGKKLPAALMEEVKANLDRVEKATGKKFGDPANPLLVAARSEGEDVHAGHDGYGAEHRAERPSRRSASRALSGNERFACSTAATADLSTCSATPSWASITSISSTSSVPSSRPGRSSSNTELDTEGLKEVVARYKIVYEQHVGFSAFPQEPLAQLEHAIEAVFKSWMGDRAIRYRELNEIRGLLGTAVNVQSMVFGNMGDDSATGVAFTRDPSTGENQFYGEFLVNAQGEDVVAGIRTPLECKTEMSKWSKKSWAELLKIKKTLEARYKDVQDFEFTIEKGKLYMLQTRNGKRTAAAAVKIAVDMVREKLIDEKTAILRVEPASLDQLLHPTFDPKSHKNVIATGLPGKPGRVPWARLPSPRRKRKSARRGRRKRSFWSAGKPSRRTSVECTLRRRNPHKHGRDDQPRGRRGPRHGNALRRRRGRGSYRRRGPHPYGQRQVVLLSEDWINSALMAARLRPAKSMKARFPPSMHR